VDIQFLAANRRLTRGLIRRWPYEKVAPGFPYVDRVVEFAVEGALITDVGAGRDTPFATRLPRACSILGIDVLPADMDANPALAARIVYDIAQNGLPDEAMGSDLVCSHFVLEHLPDLGEFAAEAFRVLRPGGVTVHRFAARWSIFALLNRLLPECAAQRVLFTLRPESRDVGGFATHYDRTDPRSAREAFELAGFQNVRTELSWQVSQYFSWFVPLFLAARAWETIARRCRLEVAASYVVLTAQRPPES
jgi:SAM-dependent methyltransferase